MGDSSKNSINLSEVSIKPFDPSIDRAAFCCGVPRIDNFFRNNARKQHEKHQVRVYVAIFNEIAIGYYYLVAATHEPSEVNKEAREKFSRVNSTPCVYLGMLGVNKNYQDNGVGKLLMLHAFKTVLSVSELIGIYALTLDAIDESKALKYEGWNFTRFEKDRLKMFIPIATLKAAGNSN